MNDIEKAVNAAERSISRFTGQLPRAESKLLNEILTLIKGFTTDANGNIATSVSNLKLLNTVKVKLGKILKNAAYINDVAKFSNAFRSLEKFQDAYFTDIGKVSKRGLLKEVGKTTVDNLINELAGTGLDRILSTNIIGELRSAILSGDNYSELVKRLQSVQTTTANQGLLSKHAGTYARDALNDFMGQRNKIIGEDLGLKWYMYVGSNLTTTREFCKHLTEKKYVHESEIPTVLSGDIDGHQCEIYDKTGLPLGLKDGTTPENFIVHRGGWNCGHQLVPVAAEAVPADVRAKIEGQTTSTQPPVKPFTMDNKAETQLRSLGYGLPPSGFVDKYNNSQIAGFNLPEFNDELEKIFANRAVKITSRDIDFYSAGGGGVAIKFAGVSASGGDVTLTRAFRIEKNGEKAVHHTYFSVPKAIQGNGISKEVFRSLYKQYRNAGVVKMDVSANIDVGGYTWAKYGFTTKKSAAAYLVDRAQVNNNFTIENKNAAKKIIDDFFKDNPNNPEFPMNLLTGYTWSKDLLKGTYWSGNLDLKDKAQRDVFEGYINWGK